MHIFPLFLDFRQIKVNTEYWVESPVLYRMLLLVIYFKRDVNTRQPYQPPDKPVCRSRSKGFKIGKGVQWGCVLSPCLFELHAGYIVWNAWLDEAQGGIKIARRNINNLRYTGDATLMAESEEELKGLLMKVKEESEKSGLKLSIQKMKILASGPITSWQIDGETVTYFIFLGSKITAAWN